MLNGLISLWALATWVQPHAIRRNSLLGLFCGVMGLPVILVTAQIYYQMQTHPLWHTPATQMSFIGTALLLGFGSMIPWLRLQGKTISNSLKVGALSWYIISSCRLGYENTSTRSRCCKSIIMVASDC
ncbi:anaerobic dimethyl sulfoxide reductase subunit [Proteus vulgaris]|nr:anaerobic dimethyl sulfoxide reductase subunit [Proteus vulgaris]